MGCVFTYGRFFILRLSTFVGTAHLRRLFGFPNYIYIYRRNVSLREMIFPLQLVFMPSPVSFIVFTFSCLIHCLHLAQIGSNRSTAMMHSIIILPLFTLFFPIYSAPAPQFDDGYTPCIESTEYKDLNFTSLYLGD